MTINLDTNVLTELASAIRTANDQITSAVNLLNQTTEHNDWGCKERVSINDYTAQNKKEARLLMEASDAFSSAVTLAVTSFVDLENSISGLSEKLESSIANVLGIINRGLSSIPQFGTFTAMMKDLLERLFATPIPIYHPLEQSGEFTTPLLLADFPDLMKSIN